MTILDPHNQQPELRSSDSQAVLSTPRSEHAQAAADRMASQWFSALVVLYIGFIAAASLLLNTGDFAVSKGIAKLTSLPGDIFSRTRSAHDLRDIATNVLLYMPLGVLAALRIRPGHARLLSPWLLLGTAISAVMEFIQAFSDRTPDPIDLMTNTTGHVVGYALTLVAIKRFHLRPSLLLGLSTTHYGDSRIKAVAGILFLYVSIYGVFQLVPFDISVSLNQVYAKLLPGKSGTPRIILDPLLHFTQGPEGILKLLYTMLALTPVAALKSYLDALRQRANLFRTVWFCLVVATATELCQVFILSRTTDIADVLLAPVAGLGGWYLIQGWLRLQGQQDPSGSRRPASRVGLVGLGMLVYICFLSSIAWTPYQFESNPRVVYQKLRYESNVLPFREHFAVRNLATARDLVEETVQFVPLGLLGFMLLSHRLSRASRLHRLVFTGVFCGFVASLLEFGQAFCRGRYVDITDVFLAALGGVIGGSLFGLFTTSEPTADAARPDEIS